MSLGVFEEMGASPYVWLALAVALFILEAITVQLISIWLGIGALAAIIPASLGAKVITQFLTFVIVSIVLIILTKPLSRKIINQKKIYHTNADSVIGKTAQVTEEINNFNATGRVMVEGIYWTARSENGDVISVDEYVVIKSIEGVKVIVAREA